ncbi:MAG: dephospho-CoA kinase, partial [Betaproteobacteria bacterium]|nr:dephospho-CoA kinase [Betaproteobacteria bacterium]
MHSPGSSTSRPLLLGLTGGIGSGKSTVSQRLAQLGAVVIDADAIARGVTAPGGAAMPAIRAQFGAEFVTSDGLGGVLDCQPCTPLGLQPPA